MTGVQTCALPISCFYPDAVIAKEGIYSKSYIPGRPVLKVKLDDPQEKMFDGVIILGGSVSKGDYIVSFPEYRYWVGFKIVSDRGRGIVFAGFWIGLSGLVLMFLSKFFKNKE